MDDLLHSDCPIIYRSEELLTLRLHRIEKARTVKWNQTDKVKEWRHPKRETEKYFSLKLLCLSLSLIQFLYFNHTIERWIHT